MVVQVLIKVQNDYKNPPDCNFLDSWVFQNFILAEELFAKALQSFKSGLSVGNNLYGI